MRSVLIIGAGLAGTAVAATLTRLGWSTTVFDKTSAAAGASGNASAVFMPRLSAKPDAQSLFSLAAYRAFTQARAQDVRTTGALRLFRSPKDESRFPVALMSHDMPPSLARVVSAQEASQLAGISLSQGGVYFPEAGWVNPRARCEWPVVKADIARLRFDHTWELLDAHDTVIAMADHVVLCCGSEVTRFEQASWLPIRPVRGQLLNVLETPQTRPLKTIVAGSVHITPAEQGLHFVGASYDWADLSLEWRHEEATRLLIEAETLSPGWSDHAFSLAEPPGRSALRAASLDTLPVIGPIPDSPPGLWVSSGLGSHGALYAPLAAEILAMFLEGTPAPLSRDLIDAVAPARFFR